MTSSYLHDDVEGVVHQKVDDEDGQEVGGKVSGLNDQPIQCPRYRTMKSLYQENLWLLT